jgi:16S rRNA (cytidine1402-2'-O)-methyltransferase
MVANLDGGKVKGESIMVIQGTTVREKPGPDELGELLRWHRDQNNLSLKDAVRRVASDLGIARTGVYQEALRVWKDKAEG